MSLSARATPPRSVLELRRRTKSLAVHPESFAELVTDQVEEGADPAATLEHLRQGRVFQIAGLPVRVDESVPPGLVELRAASGRTLQLVRL